MGQSTPTTTQAMDTFELRYKEFRAELHPKEQAWFDELVCRARRHSSAINRRPHLDFERPVMLAMLMEGMRELEEARLEIDNLRSDVHRIRSVLAEAGLLDRRVLPPTPFELGIAGQQVLAASV
jgi:hypothetical protein